MADRICSTPGCGKPHRARGFCSTCYNSTRYAPAERHKKIEMPCTWCGAACTKAAGKSRYAGRFCTLACRDAWRNATGNNPHPPHHLGLAALQSLRSRAARKLRKAARGKRGQGVWVSGLCEQCGAGFCSKSTNDLGRYCSNPCKYRARAARRRGRMHGVSTERYSRVRIFERDHWRCHICTKRVVRSAVVPHPMAPTIDHLVPLVEGGQDCAANVRTAHFMCNSTRGERGGNEQLMLFG